jgi:malate dehydrogenase (oxaloacetate-decarboxylating)(NADP+)
VNLEDIKSPECFEIEERLRKRTQHSYQHYHGTAIISRSRFVECLEIVGKKIEDCRFTVFGSRSKALSAWNCT